MFMAVIT